MSVIPPIVENIITALDKLNGDKRSFAIEINKHDEFDAVELTRNHGSKQRLIFRYTEEAILDVMSWNLSGIRASFRSSYMALAYLVEGFRAFTGAAYDFRILELSGSVVRAELITKSGTGDGRIVAIITADQDSGTITGFEPMV